MEDPAINNQLKSAFVGVACLLLAIFLGYIVGTEDYQTLLIGVVAVLGCWLWFFSGRFFWVLTIASSFLSGTFPILGGQFTPFQILMAMGLVKFLVEDVILRRTRLKLPSRFDLLMIAGFMSVILYHGIRDRFGMRFLGSDVWGGRYYVSIFVGLAAFFVIQSIPVKHGLWAKFPYVVLAVSGFDLAIALITTIAPGSIYAIYPFYSAVSNASLTEALGGTTDVIIDRVGAVGNFGLILLILIFSGVSLRKILHPSNFFRLAGVVIGGACVLLSGYRSSVFNALVAGFAIGIRDLKAAAIALVPLIAAALFIVSVVNSEIVALPKPVQRALVFVPGHWDFEMTRDARSSNEFRFSVWSLWWNQYFPQKPLLGRGFGFKSEWTKKSIHYGDAADIQQMVETGNIHNGFLATLDCLGIVGTIFFVAWNIVMLARALKIPLRGAGPDHMALCFVAIYLSMMIGSYWIGAASVGSILPQEFALAGLLLRLRKELTPARPIVVREPVNPEPRQFRRDVARV